MKLYNTLTKSIEAVVPQDSSRTTVYTCGPTVYDYPHVGNWFTFIRYDLLVRALKAAELNPEWVMNITDVGHLVSDADEGEDKLEKSAKRENKTAWDVASFYSNYFTNGLMRLGISKPDHLPKATEHINEQIDLVEQLEQKGFAYTISDGVYFDTSKFPKYADFARLDVDEQQTGARVEFNSEKRNATDFALWKFSPKDAKRDMEWDSPWGKGFPGWHIECSAMSMKYLGVTIDIHSGGIDHIPVHHTNEIAQSEAVTGKPLARYWMHTNHISVNGEKISKSLGNGITLEEIEAKGVSLEAFRLHVLESHYRSQSKFSWESLEAAQNRLKNWQASAVLRYQTTHDNGGDASISFKDYLTQLKELILDDLDTPRALALLSSVFGQLEIVGIHTKLKTEYEDFLLAVDELLGLNLADQQDISDEQKALINDREQARTRKDWQKSDELRNELSRQNIGIRDTDSGTIWFRL
jgi:cysteinyl-tRNA synthetase